MKSTWHSSEDSSIDILRSVSGTHNNNLTWWISHQTCKTIKHSRHGFKLFIYDLKNQKLSPRYYYCYLLLNIDFCVTKFCFLLLCKILYTQKDFLNMHEELQRMNCTNHFDVRIYKSVYMHERIVALKKIRKGKAFLLN